MTQKIDLENWQTIVAGLTDSNGNFILGHPEDYKVLLDFISALLDKVIDEAQGIGIWGEYEDKVKFKSRLGITQQLDVEHGMKGE